MEVKKIKTQRLLSKTQIDLADFVINPYRGCAFGCTYCYSQKNKNIEKRRQAWGSFLDVKTGTIPLLRREIERAKPKRVMLGSTTECFQPQEKYSKVTRGILEVLKEKNIPVVILTKSNAIEEHLDLIRFHPENKVYFTIMFRDDRIKDLFEKNSPGFAERIAAVKKLRQAGIAVKIHIGPFIPGLQDLAGLFQHIPDTVKEVEIEVYNSRMGNFEAMLGLIREHVSNEKAAAIKRIYSSAAAYHDFTDRLEKEAERVNKQYGFKLNIIVPEFDFWYTDKIKYE
ncbi:radical SAM protein [Candidatus Omnitrophota bacterium]